MNPDNAEEKERLITQVLEVQNTLDGMNMFDNILPILNCCFYLIK